MQKIKRQLIGLSCIMVFAAIPIIRKEITMSYHKHLTLLEREKLALALAKGQKISQIAKELCINRSTIYRELKRLMRRLPPKNRFLSSNGGFLSPMLSSAGEVG